MIGYTLLRRNVEVKDPLKQGLKQLRIKTFRLFCHHVEVKDPLKQGLKRPHYDINNFFCEKLFVEVKDPLKQGLKPGFCNRSCNLSCS